MSGPSVKRRKLSPSPENDHAQNLTGSNNEKKAPASHAVTKNNASTRRDNNDRSAELASATGLYKSNFFKLQMDELLSGLRPNYDKQVSKIQDALHKLKGIIEGIPEREPKPAAEAEKELRSEGIFVPFPEPRPAKDSKYPMSFSKPTNINVVGSFGLKTGIKQSGSYVVDLTVTMPKSLFQEKDYVNHRYFHKRAFYVSCLATGIQKVRDLGLDMKFGLQDGDSLRPILFLQSKDAKMQIRIITAIDEDLFPISRTLPMKNNIRHVPQNEGPTPFYNGSLRSEAAVTPYHKYLYSATRKCESFKDACALGRTWLRQRGFESSFQNGGFGGFEWTLLMALLFEGGGPNGKPILLTSYSSYQLFKATMQFIAGRDLTSPLQFFANDVSFPSGGPVIYDGKRGLNMLYKMTLCSYNLLRHEAAITIRMLNESREDNFDRVFIVKVNELALRFDRVISFPMSDNGDILRALHNHSTVYEVLSRALGDRIKLISLTSHCAEPWSVQTKPSTKKTNKRISVGLLLDSENASRVVDHGPPAEQKEEAASFQAFWGEKSELRRFKDGSILESLVWSEQPGSDSILYQILTYILERHFAIPEEDINYIGDEYDEQLRSGGDGTAVYNSPAFQHISDAFSSLEGSIHHMDEVPLTIRHLAPASSHLRYTSLRPGSSDPVDIVLQFESSARWPDDLEAIQMTKAAFLVKIGDCLQSSGTASSCRVGLENESSKILNNCFLGVTHTTGTVFRLRIHHDREQTLLERQLKEKGLSPRAKEEIAHALSAYKRSFVHAPRFTQAIRTLCTRFPLLSPTTRLVKYWFNCHLFTGQVTDELMELVTTRVFTQSYPWDTPSSVMTGFLRTLHFLSRWDWQQEPLMVDLAGELNQDAIETIRTRFAAWRSIDPAMRTVALFAASDIDPEGVTWTQYEMPNKVVAARMSTLAKAAVKLLREKLHDLEISDLFDTSLAPYDFVINLRPKSFGSATSTKYKNLSGQGDKNRAAKLSVVKSFVHDLQACYNQNILLFHGDEDCNVIAGLWNPQTLKPRNWSLKMAYSTIPRSFADPKAKQNEDVSINHAGILSEISRLGVDFVESIDVNGSDE